MSVTTPLLAFEALDQQLEHGRMDRSLKLQSDLEAPDPAYCRLQSFEIVELHPNCLVQIWALDELGFETMQRHVKYLDSVSALTTPPEHNLGR